MIRRPHFCPVLAAVVLLGIGASSASASCTVQCDPQDPLDCTCSGAGLCEITTGQEVDPGAVIDCGGRDVHIKGGNGRIEVDNGILTLRARDLRIETQRSIQAHRDQAGVPFGMRVELTGRLEVFGFLEAKSDYGGGSITVQADGDMVVGTPTGGDGINANATAPSSPGGRIVLASGGSVVIEDPVVADGSSLDIGEGGEISITAAGDITVGNRLSVYGHDADGGTITLTSQNGSIAVQDTIKAEGAGQEGNGGGVYLRAEQITVAALLSAQGGLGVGGASSTGGTVRLEAGGGGVVLNDDVNVTGGEAGSGLDGGAFVVESAGPVTIGNGVEVLTKSDANGGDGGDVLVAAGGALAVGDATIDARGHWGGGGQGSGARIELSGCNVSIATGALIDARGYNGGSVAIAGRETLTVGAASTVDVSATAGEPGSIVLAYRFPGTCGGDPLDGCEVGECMSPGSCSNDPQKPCTSNANCTTGCGSGQCRKICSNDAHQSCTVNADCTGCASGGCTGTNPLTSGAVFLPAAPELEENRNLEPCE
jgi:hypothetical protein